MKTLSNKLNYLRSCVTEGGLVHVLPADLDEMLSDAKQLETKNATLKRENAMHLNKIGELTVECERQYEENERLRDCSYKEEVAEIAHIMFQYSMRRIAKESE